MKGNANNYVPVGVSQVGQDTVYTYLLPIFNLLYHILVPFLYASFL